MYKNINDLNIKKKYIAPSILSANFQNLSNDIKKILSTNTQILHIDIMDGIFVDNISIGQQIIKSIRLLSNKFIFDAHLMIINPIKHIDSLIKAGVNHITFHYESLKNHLKIIQIINKIKTYKNITIGIAINPKTKYEKIIKYLSMIDLLLIMTVNPGYDSQNIIEESIKKIYHLQQYIINKNIKIFIEIDGGININNINMISSLGANILVSGSNIFKNKINIEESIKKLNYLL